MNKNNSGGKIVGRKNKAAVNPNKPFWKRHSLTLVAAGVLAVWFVLYLNANPQSHAGSFFGNAIADWLGLVITIIATKWFYEKGSRESRQPHRLHKSRVLEFLHEHSLTIFLLATGIGWVILFSRVDPESKWGSVVSNVVSEWTQQIGLVVLTKKLIEIGSKESHGEK
jgi:peptidoglycan/LPS O-acetylase OafA/YrhL